MESKRNYRVYYIDSSDFNSGEFVSEVGRADLVRTIDEIIGKGNIIVAVKKDPVLRANYISRSS